MDAKLHDVASCQGFEVEDLCATALPTERSRTLVSKLQVAEVKPFRLFFTSTCRCNPPCCVASGRERYVQGAALLREVLVPEP